MSCRTWPESLSVTHTLAHISMVKVWFGVIISTPYLIFCFVSSRTQNYLKKTKKKTLLECGETRVR